MVSVTRDRHKRPLSPNPSVTALCGYLARAENMQTKDVSCQPLWVLGNFLLVAIRDRFQEVIGMARHSAF